MKVYKVGQLCTWVEGCWKNLWSSKAYHSFIQWWCGVNH